MRPIKFRAWHTKLNKMFSAEEMSADQLTIDVNGRGFVNVSSTHVSMSTFAGEKMIPMQFTGLHDNNGKEIFEGDIVRREWENKEKEWTIGAPYEIKWHTEGIQGFMEGSQGVIEVLGNIYENPELLK